ncbi:hypothetical protein ACFL27_09465, partial [candidate division CSSED10-310 bacterium]
TEILFYHLFGKLGGGLRRWFNLIDTWEPLWYVASQQDFRRSRSKFFQIMVLNVTATQAKTAMAHLHSAGGINGQFLGNNMLETAARPG